MSVISLVQFKKFNPLPYVYDKETRIYIILCLKFINVAATLYLPKVTVVEHTFFPNTALYKFSSFAPALGEHAPHIIRDENRATRAKTELLLKAVHHNERGKWRALKNAVSNLSGKISFRGWRLKCVSKLNP
jgi:hypothetical protein